MTAVNDFLTSERRRGRPDLTAAYRDGTKFPFRSTDAFLYERRDWLRVCLVPDCYGSDGWDIVLRIDGTYYLKQEAEQVTAFMAGEISRMPIRQEGRL